MSDEERKPENAVGCEASALNVLLCCDNCGEDFNRTKDYMAQNRNDPLYKWKTKKCDTCVDKRVNKAFTNLPNVMQALAT